MSADGSRRRRGSESDRPRTRREGAAAKTRIVRGKKTRIVRGRVERRYVADVTSLPNVAPHRGAVVGTQAAAASAAWVLGPAAGGLLASSVGVAESFLAVGAVTGVCSLAYARYVPETLAAADSTDDDDDGRRASLLDDSAQRTCLFLHACLNSNYAACLAILPLQCAEVWERAGRAARAASGGPSSMLQEDGASVPTPCKHQPERSSCLRDTVDMPAGRWKSERSSRPSRRWA